MSCTVIFRRIIVPMVVEDLLMMCTSARLREILVSLLEYADQGIARGLNLYFGRNGTD